MQFIIFLGIIGFAAAQSGGNPNGNPLWTLISTEVKDLYNGTRSLTVNGCTEQCDTRFDLSGGSDERMTDDLCRRACTMQSQTPLRPGHDIDNSMHNLIHAEVEEIMHNNAGISLDNCATKCDSRFDFNVIADERVTDTMCREECAHQMHMRPGGGDHGGN